jgi:hypothetical protein
VVGEVATMIKEDICPKCHGVTKTRFLKFMEATIISPDILDVSKHLWCQECEHYVTDRLFISIKSSGNVVHISSLSR